MKIRFSRHAIERIRKRKISKKEVTDAIIEGQFREIQEYGIIKCIYKNKERKLIVIYKQSKENYKIITAYYED